MKSVSIDTDVVSSNLDQGEVCEFESKPSGMGVEATFVAGPGGIECKGSSRRPLSRKKFKKIRSDLVPDNLVYFLLVS